MTIIHLDLFNAASELYPLSGSVLLLRTVNKTWCLFDGHRYGPAHDTAESCLLDRTTFRRLDLGEELRRAEPASRGEASQIGEEAKP